MNRSNRSSWRVLVPVVLALAAGLATSVQAAPVTDEFTYQGELVNAGTPANGSFDFRFRLYDAAAGGVQVGAQIIRTATCTDGKFTTTLQFPGVFNGTALWLEIDAAPAGSGSWTTLGPRQALTVTPNAAFSMLAASAQNAQLLGGQNGGFYTNASNLNAGTLPSARLQGAYSNALSLSNPANSFTGSGAGLTSLNASAVSSGTLSDARLSSNVAFLNIAQSFTATKSFPAAPAFNAVGAPFAVSSTALVTNLNADMVDGQHASSFSLAGHTHAATDIVSGVLSDARLSSNVALLNTAQTFTAVKTFGANAIFNASVGIGTASPLYPSHIVDTGGIASYVNNDGGASVPYGFYSVVNSTTTKYGYYADVNGNLTGTGYGLYINNESPSGRGVYAITSGTGSNYGYYNSNSGDTGRGFYASMTGAGVNYGVYISNSSISGYGGYFNNTALSGTTYGLFCENNSPDGYGLYARHDASTGLGPAVYGTTDSTSSGSTSGGAYGVHGIVNSTAPGGYSAGVRGENRGTSGSGIGVWGSHAGSGWGGYFTSESGYGVYATSTDFYAVRGISTNSYGVYGSSTASYGVRGISTSSYGMYGTSTDNYGVYGTSTNDYGVRGYSTNSYGGHFDTGVSGGVALYVVGTASVGVITIRGGADLAENFEVKSEPDSVLPGMVVMIDDEHPGAMELAVGAYNRRVAGVVSGANELSAGMILGEFEGLENAKPVALTGRVWTFVDASQHAVEPGDLLTTSDTPGYAMPVADQSRAHGATIGKAMSRLEKGEKGMVLVLINLQ
jgi:hypothetical protein